MRIISIVEATTLNAVSKVTLEFFRTAHEMPEMAAVQGSIITFNRDTDNPGAPNEFILATQAAGLEIDVIPERRRFDLSVISALREIIEQSQPDFVVTNSVKSHFLMWRSRLSKKHRWVAYHHGYTATDQKMRLYNRFDRWSLPKAHQVLTVCDAFARELNAVAKVPTERIRVQHNPIRLTGKPDPALVQTHRERLGVDKSEQVILSVGRLSKEKGHADLITAFQHFSQNESTPAGKLVIVGDGPERARLEAQAVATGYGQRIVFAGQIRDVQPSYALADVFALPSHSEGSPNVLLEAMAAEVPVVATSVGGVPEIVRDETSALLVPAGDPSSMAAALARSLTDGELSRRLTTNALALVKSRHSPQAYVRSLMETLSGV